MLLLLAPQVFNEQVPRHELGEGNAGLVVIRNGTVRVHWLRGKDNHWRFACIKSAVESARSLHFPDTAFIVNIDDFPICKDKRCPLPVFTNYKKWRNGRNLETNEVLFPVSKTLLCPVVWQDLPPTRHAARRVRVCSVKLLCDKFVAYTVPNHVSSDLSDPCLPVIEC